MAGVVTHTLADLKARTIKPTYHGKDIPVGEYARALKDSKRSEAEQFLEWVVEQENLVVKTLHLTAEEFASRYKAFKGEGEDRGTDGIMKQLKLLCVPGVEQFCNRSERLTWCKRLSITRAPRSSAPSAAPAVSTKP